MVPGWAAGRPGRRSPWASPCPSQSLSSPTLHTAPRGWMARRGAHLPGPTPHRTLSSMHSSLYHLSSEASSLSVPSVTQSHVPDASHPPDAVRPLEVQCFPLHYFLKKLYVGEISSFLSLKKRERRRKITRQKKSGKYCKLLYIK